MRQEQIATAATTLPVVVAMANLAAGSGGGTAAMGLAGVLKAPPKGPSIVIKSRAACRPDVQRAQHAGVGRAVV